MLRGPGYSRRPLPLEEVVVYLLDLLGLPHYDAQVMAHHEPDEVLAVDEDEADRDGFGVVPRALAEAGRGDKDAAMGMGPLQRADEGLDFGAGDDSARLVVFGAHSDQVKAEGVRVDDAVKPNIASSRGDDSGALRPAVAHRAQQFDRQFLEEVRPGPIDLAEEFVGDLAFDALVASVTARTYGIRGRKELQPSGCEQAQQEVLLVLPVHPALADDSRARCPGRARPEGE